MLNDVPHNKGVLVLGNGLGGGLQRADRGDRCARPSAAGSVQPPAAAWGGKPGHLSRR